jgi:aspartokinase-like uncharacterized kinase
LLEDEARAGRLPQTWAVTSDAIAARVAEQLGATRLVLLKSVPVPADVDWRAAARLGLVDATFPQVVERAGLQATAVNLRS